MTTPKTLYITSVKDNAFMFQFNKISTTPVDGGIDPLIMPTTVTSGYTKFRMTTNCYFSLNPAELNLPAGDFRFKFNFNFNYSLIITSPADFLGDIGGWNSSRIFYRLFFKYFPLGSPQFIQDDGSVFYGIHGSMSDASLIGEAGPVLKRQLSSLVQTVESDTLSGFSGVINLNSYNTGRYILMIRPILASNGLTTLENLIFNTSIYVNAGAAPLMLKNSNSNLSSLTPINGIVLNQTFSPTVLTGYTITTSTTTSSIKLIPVSQSTYSTIKIGGVVVASGSESPTIVLTGTTTTINVVVTAQSGSPDISTYTITVTQVAPLTLSSLTLSSGTLIPSPFSPSTNTYAANNVANTTIASVTTDAANAIQFKIGSSGAYGAVITGGSGNTGAVSVPVGSVTPVFVQIAKSGSAPAIYTVNLANASDTGASISLGSGTPPTLVSSAPDVYTSTVTGSGTSVVVSPTNPGAIYTVNGNPYTPGTSIPISPTGVTPIVIVVTAPDGTIKTSTINVTSASNSLLGSLSLSAGSLNPTFASNTIKYDSSVSGSTTSVTASGIDPTSKYVVSWPAGSSWSAGSTASTPSGTPTTNNIPIPSVLTVVITSGDGTSTKTYTIKAVSNTNSSIANIDGNGNSGITLSAGNSYTPTFVNTTHTYIASVPSGTTGITVTLENYVSTYTITVNSGAESAHIASGIEYPGISVPYSSTTATTILVTVYPETGSSTSTYTLLAYLQVLGDADLTGLTMTNSATSVDYTLTPLFLNTTTDYSANVGVGESSTFKATALHPKSTYTVKLIRSGSLISTSSSIDSGTASASFPLSSSDVYDLTIISPNGTIKIYSITITTGDASDSTISSLSFGGVPNPPGNLYPAFSRSNPGPYSLVVSPSGTTTITATMAVGGAKFKVDDSGIETASNSTSTNTIGTNTNLGAITLFKVIGISANDQKTSVYTFHGTTVPLNQGGITNIQFSNASLSAGGGAYTFVNTQNTAVFLTSPPTSTTITVTLSNPASTYTIDRFEPTIPVQTFGYYDTPPTYPLNNIPGNLVYYAISSTSPDKSVTYPAYEFFISTMDNTIHDCNFTFTNATPTSGKCGDVGFVSSISNGGATTLALFKLVDNFDSFLINGIDTDPITNPAIVGASYTKELTVTSDGVLPVEISYKPNIFTTTVPPPTNLLLVGELNPTIVNLQMSNGVLSTFNTADAIGTTYTASIPSSTTTVKTILKNPYSKFLVADNSSTTFASNTFSSNVTINPVGRTTIPIRLQFPNGTTTSLAQRNIVATLDSDSSLFSLSVAPGALFPSFVSTNLNYVTNVPGSSSVTVTAEVSNALSTMTYSTNAGTTVTPFSGSTPVISVPSDSSVDIEIEITPPNSSSAKTKYVVKAVSESNARISDLRVESPGVITLFPPFNTTDASGTSYSANGLASTANVTIEPVNPSSTVTIGGVAGTPDGNGGFTRSGIPINASGITPIVVVVHPPSGADFTYTINASQVAADDSSLAGLTVPSPALLTPASTLR